MAGPFDHPPFEHYIQSPIGLVPKAGNSGKTRLIFHLSYKFGLEDSEQSLNYATPKEVCSVHYNDLDHPVKNCLITKEQVLANVWFDEIENSNDDNDSDHNGTVYMGKTDVESAFCLVPLSPWSWMWFLMYAKNPVTKVGQYFVDKCLPFGASISCAIFQRFSNALCHITKVRTRMTTITNYLDDFHFLAYTKALCNAMISSFLDICNQVGVPIAVEKKGMGNDYSDLSRGTVKQNRYDHRYSRGKTPKGDLSVIQVH